MNDMQDLSFIESDLVLEFKLDLLHLLKTFDTFYLVSIGLLEKCESVDQMLTDYLHVLFLQATTHFLLNVLVDKGRHSVSDPLSLLVKVFYFNETELDQVL